jgi:dienelactone hydrolase
MIVLGAAAGVPSSAAPVRVTVAVSPAKALIDAPVDVRVRGLVPRSNVVLVATTRDASGRGWRSRLAFTASRRGVVDTLGKMKLFWSMRPTKTSTPQAPMDLHGELRTLIRALVRGHTVASATVARRAVAAGLSVKETTLDTDGIVGTYYALPSSAPAPAVLTLGGSAGGHDGGLAARLASHGYRSLSLGYFKEPGLPQELRRIPLEYFQTALRWLGSQPGVDPRRLVVVGVSRGGEAALLVGATFGGLVHGVISCTGSANVNGSFPEGDAAWTLGGKPVPYGRIPVEQIAGPVLAFGGGHDAVGNSAAAVQQIVDEATMVAATSRAASTPQPATASAAPPRTSRSWASRSTRSAPRPISSAGGHCPRTSRPRPTRGRSCFGSCERYPGKSAAPVAARLCTSALCI